MITDIRQSNHLFGPVPSRRLGMSLGVDIIPFKTCTLNCVYCECGKTTRHTLSRKEYIPADEIIRELDRFMQSGPYLDVITFAGSGEPTLNTGIGRIIKHIRSTYPHYKTALLTNSTLLPLKEVRTSILPVDYVLPSLDAVSQPVFEKINNPLPGLSSAEVVDGLTAFAKEYTGILWVEVFIVPGINDTDEELSKIKHVLDKIEPARVQVNTLDRPAAYAWVQPAPAEQLSAIAEFFKPLPVEIISRNSLVQTKHTGSRQIADTLITALKIRPMTIEDLAVALQININEVFSLLDDLRKKRILSEEKVGDKTFYKVI